MSEYSPHGVTLAPPFPPMASRIVARLTVRLHLLLVHVRGGIAGTGVTPGGYLVLSTIWGRTPRPI